MDLHSDKASQSVFTWALEVLLPPLSILLLLLQLFGIQQFFGAFGVLGGPRQLVSSVETKVFNRSRYWLYSSTSLWPAPCNVIWSDIIVFNKPKTVSFSTIFLCHYIISLLGSAFRNYYSTIWSSFWTLSVKLKLSLLQCSIKLNNLRQKSSGLEGYGNRACSQQGNLRRYLYLYMPKRWQATWQWAELWGRGCIQIRPEYTISAGGKGANKRLSASIYNKWQVALQIRIQIQCRRGGCQGTISKHQHQNKNNIPPPTKAPQRGGNAHKWRDRARSQSPRK